MFGFLQLHVRCFSSALVTWHAAMLVYQVCLSADISVWFELGRRSETATCFLHFLYVLCQLQWVNECPVIMSSDWCVFGLHCYVVIYYWTNFGKPHFTVNISRWLVFELSSFNTDTTAEEQTSCMILVVVVVVGCSHSDNTVTVVVMSCLITVYHIFVGVRWSLVPVWCQCHKCVRGHWCWVISSCTPYCWIRPMSATPLCDIIDRWPLLGKNGKCPGI